MNKTFRFFTATIICIAPFFSAGAAFQVKKASSVSSASESSGSSSSSSLVPSVLGLVSGVMSVNAQQKSLSAECIPSQTEMNFVDDAMKEWAKTGAAYYDDGADSENSHNKIGNRSACATNNGTGYETDVKTTEVTNSGTEPCYNNLRGAGNSGMVWEFFPKTGKGYYCKNGEWECSEKEKVTVSDTYDLFAMIDFGPSDYKPSEATMAAKLMEKVEKCSKTKLNAKKKALWGEFLVNTAGSVGQKTDTSAIMEQVGVITSNGAAGAVGSLGTVAAQFLDK